MYECTLGQLSEYEMNCRSIGVSITEINERLVETEKQGKPASMCRLALLGTLRKIHIWE